MPPCPLFIYVLAAEAFGYLLASQVSLGVIRGIRLPGNQGQLVNGHFADDSFLTLAEEEQSIIEALNCFDIFCKASISSIQWRKTFCFRQSPLSISEWLKSFQWHWIQHGEIFKFLGILFAFYGELA